MATKTNEHRIRAILPFFGGKRTLAPEIVKQIGPHSQYFEPFCGSMAVLLAKDPSQKETVNDLHGDLTNLARCLQDDALAPYLFERLSRVLVSEGLLEEAQALLEEHPFPTEFTFDASLENADRAYWYFIACWQGRNGTCGTRRQDYQLAVRWTNSGGSPTVRFRNAVESIPWWHQRLKNVVIMRRDAFEFIHKLEDSPKTAIYCDPPYLMDTRTGSGNSNYLHEFNHGSKKKSVGLFQEEQDEQNDHERLAEILNSYKEARVVVSYYAHSDLHRLYPGWTVLDHSRLKSLCAPARRASGKDFSEAPEVILINGPEHS